jgi:hypothetical protein
MKPLPKEFQFKCDEHSLEQCKKLGIDNPNNYTISLYKENMNAYYCVLDNNITDTDIDIYDQFKLISLADYIEEETEEQKIERLLNEAIASMPKEKFNKIVQKVNAMSIKEEPSYPDPIIERLDRIIHLLENTQFLNELKEKGYIR